MVCLQKLWCYAARLRPDGILRGMDPEDIAIAVQWHGAEEELVRVLVELRWLDLDDEGVYILHQWMENNPWASGTETRGDSGRFSKLAQVLPEVHRRLSKQGVSGISKKQYEEIKQDQRILNQTLVAKTADTQRVVDDSQSGCLADAQRVPNDLPGVSLAPSPSPSPSPKTKKPESSSSSSLPPPAGTKTDDDDDGQGVRLDEALTLIQANAEAVMPAREFHAKYHECFGVLMPPALNEEVRRILGRYPRDRLLAAFMVTAEKGGKSFSYLKKVIENEPSSRKTDWDAIEAAAGA